MRRICLAGATLFAVLLTLANQASAQPIASAVPQMVPPTVTMPLGGNVAAGTAVAAPLPVWKQPIMPNPNGFPFAYGAYGGYGVSYFPYRSLYGDVMRYPNNGLGTYGPYVYPEPMRWPPYGGGYPMAAPAAPAGCCGY